jgi:hypothetical protein
VVLTGEKRYGIIEVAKLRWQGLSPVETYF